MTFVFGAKSLKQGTQGIEVGSHWSHISNYNEQGLILVLRKEMPLRAREGISLAVPRTTRLSIFTPEGDENIYICDILSTLPRQEVSPTNVVRCSKPTGRRAIVHPLLRRDFL